MVFGDGFIPAHAGKTGAPASATSPSRAHPRSRGDNQRGDVLALPAVGSSPLTRGKPGAYAATPVIGRLIPAHAGKTYERKTGQPITRAHPRSRGENIHPSSISIMPSGSSPLTRGKLSN